MNSGVVTPMLSKEIEYDVLFYKVTTFQTTDTINLVKKTIYNIMSNEIENKIPDHDYSSNYTNMQEFNKLTAENSASRLANKN